LIKVLVADDHAVVRQGVCSLIRTTQDIEVACEAADGGQVLALIARKDLSLLVVDMNMPGPSGIDLIRSVRQSRPELPALVLSMLAESQVAQSALLAGANGYLSKTSEPEVILSAIRQCATGGSYIDPTIAASLLVASINKPEAHGHDALSKRELQIMLMLASGMSVNRISDQLFVSPKTVSTHKFRIMQKLGMESIAELVRYALRKNLIDR
jgi:DNA-binding NarL/FixJ family response regulator